MLLWHFDITFNVLLHEDMHQGLCVYIQLFIDWTDILWNDFLTDQINAAKECVTDVKHR